ncbi:hypothetical protein AGMMS49546_00260 [Spirochaetia bacterium]|nr:hypothetical protein AGMMS49546_00260 [Spirochaetia bacterium]
MIIACKTAPEPQGKSAGGIDGVLQIYTLGRLIPLYTGEGESPHMHIRLSLVDVRNQDGLNKGMGGLFRELFYAGMSPQDYADKFIAGKELEYRSLQDILQEPDRPSATLNWEYEEVFEVDIYQPGLAVIHRNWYEYTGGAHGNHGTTYFVIDPAAAKRLTLDDIVKTTARPLILEQTEEALRSLRGLKAGAPLTEGGFFENSVSIPDNFFLSSEGLGFHWDPYEIAPYSDDSIEVILPYESIGDFLTEKGRSLARELQ